MKRVLLVVMIVLILLMVGCNKKESTVQEESVSKEAVDIDLNTEFYERTKIINEMNDDINNSFVTVSEKLESEPRIHEKSLGSISLINNNDNYIMEISVLDAVAFDKSKIDEVVNYIVDNNLEFAYLGDFKISKRPPDELVKHIDYMYDEGISGIELGFWGNYKEQDWLDEEGIPRYIQKETPGREDYFWTLEKVSGTTSNTYYMFRIENAGQTGLYSIYDEANPTKIDVELLADDKITIKEYSLDYSDEGLESENTYNVEEYFNSKYERTNEVKLDAANVEVQDDAIVLEFYYGEDY